MFVEAHAARSTIIPKAGCQDKTYKTTIIIYAIKLETIRRYWDHARRFWTLATTYSGILSTALRSIQLEEGKPRCQVCCLAMLSPDRWCHLAVCDPAGESQSVGRRQLAAPVPPRRTSVLQTRSGGVALSTCSHPNPVPPTSHNQRTGA